MPTYSPTILALETSSELASCALLHAGRLSSRSADGVRTHSASLLPMVQELLAGAGIALADCDAIAYGAGPGSFTGVRTACGIAQGLGFGAGLPLVPVVTLDAMALACRERHGAAHVLAVLDARMNEVYWAQYRFDEDAGDAADGLPTGLPIPVLPAALSAPADVHPQGAPLACGNGLAAYPEAFAGKPFVAGADTAVLPHAEQIARLGAAAFAAGQGVPPAAAQPLYLRNKVAYTKAERAVINAAQGALQSGGKA
ncbi:tRNA (adenosine(37)-N6)-threonylcarbamoyltransferase complex dimerization subunit type 1 TsaB [Pseudoduganella umbonata]|uniref:tRNA (Adenosine(37)-N6)-threonylcarbamoyltransferase complex dimerization subunit type 1 TsaB n=1 Tax=Pseudoduganella umbonata TaxID=864828 RepID=A0A4P8HZA0_9BURK|nr:tRNA (adenosine(37)-N6)-threonylcarbamoyltransferase complex dimerization subunit type 1 TsaB [Pseudoduganella umbonata]MBB3221798.1 tRNA threonylcarbamoyladenosine biosynthesis protein TsaB [Pseudoduganella umbonata]QCP14392.1 tRNA (adenosine(37)-N6)-threonylcarbamoyltransferase complex dimerization subunit type 1 TsaB [Pseudoduganella umbonata]